jgi:RimJ/RimL family protein N-acetyltransferase
MSEQPVLRGAKVVLRPWGPEDADTVFAICQDPAIQRWTTVPSPYLRTDAVDYVSELAPGAWRDGGAVFAVEDQRTGSVVGSIGSHGMRDGVAHVGYWTAATARGNGFMTDALRTLTQWLLHERGAARVELAAEPDNLASVRVALKAGFVAEGVLRSRLLLHGHRRDVAMFSVLPTDPGAGNS